MNKNTPFKSLSMALLLLLAGTVVQAQSIMSEAKQHITYEMQSGDGTNASALVYVPSMNCYVTAIAGNASFPMEFFSLKGEPISQGETGLDLRGMWWNGKALVANAAGEEGWFSISPEDLKSGSEWNLVRDGQIQPNFQSVLTYTGKMVVGFDGTSFYFYTKSGKFKKQVELSGYSGSYEELNSTSVGYTGVSAFPLAVLNWADYKVEFFSLTGQHLGSTNIPGDHGDLSSFRFAIANKMAWIYSTDTRSWTAFRLFN